MKRMLFAGALAIAPMTLAACATTPSIQLSLGHADAAAWTSYKGASVILSGLAKSGQLHGASAARARDGLVKVKALLLASDAAYRAGKGADAQTNAAAATAILTELLTIAAQAQKGA